MFENYEQFLSHYLAPTVWRGPSFVTGGFSLHIPRSLLRSKSYTLPTVIRTHSNKSCFKLNGIEFLADLRICGVCAIKINTALSSLFGLY